MAQNMRVQLPKELLQLPIQERAAVVEDIAKSLQIPTRLDDEHNVWARDPEPIIGDLEDEFYEALTAPMWGLMGGLFDTLGLPLVDPSTTSVESIQKAFGEGFYDWHYQAQAIQAYRGYDLEKAQKPDIQTLIQQAREAREKVLTYTEGAGRLGTPFLLRLESILKRYVPNYGKIASDMAAKAVRAGKAISEAELRGLTILDTVTRKNPTSEGVPIRTVDLLPVTFDLVDYNVPTSDGKMLELPATTSEEQQAMEFARLHAGSKIQLQDEKMKEGVKQLVMRAVHERWTTRRLSQELFDAFGTYNRDWRRIALTELSEALTNGYIGSLNDGDRVEGITATNGCKHCRRLIDSKVYIVSKVPRWDKPDQYVWVGKTNYGRTTKDYVACVPLHPHCRCRWQRMSDFYAMEEGKMKLRSVDELYEMYKRGELKAD